MKLGTQTASLTNHIYSRAVVGQPEPEVGMGATILSWTDRHAATIIEVNKVRGDELLVVIREDNAKVVNGSTHNGSAEYEYERDPTGSTHTFRRSKDGYWQAVDFNAGTKRWRKVEGYGLRIGAREEYHDPSF